MASYQERQLGSAKLWRAVTMCAFAVFVFLGFAYLLLGRANADEGWYLYASRLVYQGEVPYRDFAYTQTPLLPYVYGLPQVLLGPGMYLGRITSFLFSVANLGLCILLAKRHSGDMAAGLTALLFATFTYGVYFGVIVKTYALLSFLFTLTFFILSSRLTGDAKYPLAAVVAVFAIMVRLSATAFAVVIIMYCVIKARRHVRYIILALCVLIIILALPVAMTNLHALEWNLLGHHLGQWGELSTLGRIREILTFRIPGLIVFFLSYLLLGLSLASIIVGKPRIRRKAGRYVRHHPPVLVATIGLIAFACSHMVTGGFYAEYFVPAITSMFPVLSIALVGALRCLGLGSRESATHRRPSAWSRALLHVVFVTCLILVPIRQSASFVDLSGGQMPIEEIREVARYVACNTDDSDRVLALEALWIPVEAQRDVLPGLTMAHFSYQNVSRQEAQELKLVNSELLLEYVDDAAAKAIVLTDLDLEMLRQSGIADPIRHALLDHYELGLTKPEFGQRSSHLYVYLRDH